ncbi:MAG: multiheme c-type cytochrome, partial [Deltaproteobacteria bacterium]|nr:multiheme c-type cytochrome [Deltaproteobacteria bacterium]
MKNLTIFILLVSVLVPVLLFAQGSAKKEMAPPISQETFACLNCHKVYTPGIVEDWLKSRHSKTLPSSALKKAEKARRISAKKVAASLEKVVVGCYECHSLNAEKHRDNFEHMGFKINVIVSPRDCATCHPVEVKQFSDSKKAHAVGNLVKNPVYHTLVETVISKKTVEDGKVVQKNVSDLTRKETCFSCHGTEVKVSGMETVKTAMGEVEVPRLTNWPNQGV